MERKVRIMEWSVTFTEFDWGGGGWGVGQLGCEWLGVSEERCCCGEWVLTDSCRDNWYLI